MTNFLDYSEEDGFENKLTELLSANKNCYQNSIDYYFSLLKDIPILSKKEEQELFIKYLNGDTKARVMLILCNFKLVLSIVNKYMKKGMIIDDMIQEGLTGLIKAVDSFDVNKDFKFSTYAFYWIRKYVLEYTYDNYFSSISQRDKKNLNIIQDAIVQLKEKNNLSVDNIVALTNLPKKKVLQLLGILNKPVSLNDNITDDYELLFDDVLFSLDNVEQQVEQKNKLNDLKNLLLISNLTEEEINVLFFKYGFLDDPKGNTEIASIMNIKQNRVIILEGKGLKKIRLSPYLKEIVEFLNKDQGEFIYVKR